MQVATVKMQQQLSLESSTQTLSVPARNLSDNVKALGSRPRSRSKGPDDGQMTNISNDGWTWWLERRSWNYENRPHNLSLDPSQNLRPSVGVPAPPAFPLTIPTIGLFHHKSHSGGRDLIGSNVLPPSPHVRSGMDLFRWHLHFNMGGNWFADMWNANVVISALFIHNVWTSIQKIVHMLYLLGSDTMMKFECSKLLPSAKADTDYVFLMYRLSRNMTEPFRSRAQKQLRLILQFRGTDIPPSVFAFHSTSWISCLHLVSSSRTFGLIENMGRDSRSRSRGRDRQHRRGSERRRDSRVRTAPQQKSTLMKPTQKHRRILSIFRVSRLPAIFSWHWWLQPH